MRAIPASVAAELTAFFRRNGYVPRHDAARYAAEAYMQYKKGEEVRLVANGGEGMRADRASAEARGVQGGASISQGCSDPHPHLRARTSGPLSEHAKGNKKAQTAKSNASPVRPPRRPGVRSVAKKQTKNIL